MASAFQETRSHFEEDDSPTVSVHGARGNDAGAGAGASVDSNGRSEDISSDDHVQEKAGAGVVLTKKQKVKRHCGRFWWWYLIGLIIFLAIFLPILFTVIIPAIVQDIVDKQSFPIKGGSFVALSPSQLSVSLQTQIDTPVAADMDPTTLFLYNHDTKPFSPFLNITLPKTHIDGKTEINVAAQTVTITDEAELASWFDKVFDNPQVKLSTRGNSKVHLGALHTTAHIDKTVEVGALNQLTGFGIQELQLVVPAMENGTNIKGTLNLPNWGVLTLGIGDIGLNLMAGDVRVGLIHVHDVTLPPGNNTRNFDGELFIDALLQNFGTVLASQASSLSSGNIQIDATGNETIVNGEHLTFVETVLNKKRVTSTISVVKLVSDALASFTGGSGDASITDLFGEIFGNSTFLEGIMDNWEANRNTTGDGSSARPARVKRTLPRVPRGLPGSTALNLLKMGMKMNMAKR
ncbi:hypothetical protein F4780DRAFT_18666 [Xylariomycetidae sp. FL0641]|nr:hypothetical protein F4780DRAFT_18666 [Xylariomycetidae sp. FL0641]